MNKHIDYKPRVLLFLRLTYLSVNYANNIICHYGFECILIILEESVILVQHRPLYSLLSRADKFILRACNHIPLLL